MATLTTSKVASTVQARAGIDITSVTGSYSVSSNLAANDVIQMVKIPAGATVLEIIASASASIGATATAEIGDGSDTDRFVTSGTFGQGAASLTRLNAATGNGYTYTAEDTIDIKILTMATPATGATITLTAIYTMQS